jgi:hypothetical protein
VRVPFKSQHAFNELLLLTIHPAIPCHSNCRRIRLSLCAPVTAISARDSFYSSFTLQHGANNDIVAPPVNAHNNDVLHRICVRYDPSNAHLWVNLYVGLLLDLAVTGIVKAVFRRGRPQYNGANTGFTFAVDQFSFPVRTRKKERENAKIKQLRF